MWPLDYPSSLFSFFASSRKNFQKTIFDASLLFPPSPSSSQWLYRKHSIVTSGTLEEVFYIFPPIWFAHFQFSATTTWFFFALPSERFVYQTDRYFFPPREGWEMGDKLNTCTVKRHFAYMQMCLVRRFVSSSFDRHQHWSVLRSQENQWTRELGGEWGGEFPIQKVDRKLTFKSANPHPRSLWRDQWRKTARVTGFGSVRFGRRFHSHRWWVWCDPGTKGCQVTLFIPSQDEGKNRPFFTLAGVTLTRFSSVKHHIQHHYTPFCWIGRTSLFRGRVDVWYMDRMKENVAFFHHFFFHPALFSILGTKTALTLVDYFPAHWNSNGIRVLRLFFWFIEKSRRNRFVMGGKSDYSMFACRDFNCYAKEYA